MDDLLLEIGTEEIPAGYIQPALDALASNLTQKLSAARIVHGSITTYGTPRRLAVMAAEVLPRQTPSTAQVLGPPERIAFDVEGRPTMAALKFAEKVGQPARQLKIVETEKGRYIGAVSTDKGADTRRVLRQMLPEVILSIPFPKKMRWADKKISFARPIHGILALLGGQIIPFKLDGSIKSSRFSHGHMFMHAGRIKVPHARDYVQCLRQGRVIVDIQERRAMVAQQIAQAAALSGHILPDAALLDIVTNLVEIPFATGGKFEEIFLELPREILITAMREHQKYFAVVDDSDRLLPCFVAVNNTQCKDEHLVANGHERVLRARLADARFFYRADCKHNMDDWHKQLKGVLFQARLGSMYEKTQRVQRLGVFLAEQAAPQLSTHVMRAAQLCKADLVSQVVYEFPNLQGIMGRHYALLAGEDPDVAAAIEEHYRPIYSGAPLPQTMTGALLALAEKLDTICGCFSVGLQPTGASDPYALRRQGFGIVQIMRTFKMGFSLQGAIAESLSRFEHSGFHIAADVCDFIRQRIAHMLAEQGFAKDIIAAVINVTVDNIPDVWKRAEALQQLKGIPDFEPLAVAFKRVVNILRKTSESIADSANPALFEDPCEFQLFQAVGTVRAEVDRLLAKDDLLRALQAIAGLRPPVDLFFDQVMVMSDDAALRRNRLALLQSIASLFEQIADFSKITT